jgi:hypothetical protein
VRRGAVSISFIIWPASPVPACLRRRANANSAVETLRHSKRPPNGSRPNGFTLSGCAFHNLAQVGEAGDDFGVPSKRGQRRRRTLCKRSAGPMSASLWWYVVVEQAAPSSQENDPDFTRAKAGSSAAFSAGRPIFVCIEPRDVLTGARRRFEQFAADRVQCCSNPDHICVQLSSRRFPCFSHRPLQRWRHFRQRCP